MNGIWKIILLGAVLAILILFALGLNNDPRNIPSPLVNRPATNFTAPALDGGPPVSLEFYRGKWVLVNFWGSWCISCISEHPYLLELANKAKMRKDFVIIGVDFRDTPEAAKAFLARHGNPGYKQAMDPEQKIAIDWGVYGAPESYLVDPMGTIRMKHTGPLFPGWFEMRALPLMEGGER
ncbi:MAG: DsbE family thiol:disulfide interchange protein [Magnetococcales bacterium]|nr:DsbE family thiol:disulfide interchange protein [Magnetococcales bacterium]MBF0439928.1 DsbE family thiol:disulfide interchange protein [Magnetococcales bacterium]